jgi:hypothetical protein
MTHTHHCVAQSVVLEVAVRHVSRGVALARALAGGMLRPARAAASAVAPLAKLATAPLATAGSVLLSPLMLLTQLLRAAVAALTVAWCVLSSTNLSNAVQ